MEAAAPEIVHCQTLEDCYALIVGSFYEQMHEAVDRQGYATIALSGGKTPAGLFEAIAHSPLTRELPWDNVFIFFVDERVVPADHSDSNYGLFRKHLLAFLPIPEHQIFRMPVEVTPLSAAARHYQQTMVDVFSRLTERQGPYAENQYPMFDLILLGMGRDGHTASLFPSHPALGQREWVAAVDSDQAVPAVPRLTLTLPVLNQADTVVFLISGEEKVHLAESFLTAEQAMLSYPASLVRPQQRLLWYLVL